MEDVIIANGKRYVPEVTTETLEYVIVRTYSAGVFAGYLLSREGKEATLIEARRIWYWEGAASLSELSQKGTNAPAKCKFPAPVPSVILTEAIEILSVSPEAQKSIAGVPVWTMQ